MVTPAQRVDFLGIDEALEERLSLLRLPLSEDLEVYEQYFNVVELAERYGCRSLLVEDHYIDRDHIEDHSVFYSKSFVPFRNFCQRVHFFDLPKTRCRAEFRKLLRRSPALNDTAFADACLKFSREHYLGFMVVRPLPGSPVGRTVLRPPVAPENSAKEAVFPSCRDYKVHVLGIPLTVRGLAFQQQDVAVSACATTALWSSLQRTRDFEDLRLLSPAGITQAAAQYMLTFGRAMPSEGLSTEQMCAAVEASGVAPSLIRVTGFSTGRSHLYSATLSGFAPVLVLQNAHDPELFHAVVVAGAVLQDDEPHLVAVGLRDAADRLVRVYIHDDRIGPFVDATLVEINAGDERSLLQLQFGRPWQKPEEWNATHMLVPVHNKIRISVPGLYDDIARNVVSRFEGLVPATDDEPVVFDARFELSQRYLERLVRRGLSPTAKDPWRLLTRLPLPRYVGLVRIWNRHMGRIDVLVDSTSTTRNVNFIGMLYWAVRGSSFSADFRDTIAQLDCDLFAMGHISASEISF